MGLEDRNYDALLAQIRNQNNRIQQPTSPVQINRQVNQPQQQSFDRTNLRRLEGIESGIAGFKNVGDSIYEGTGFGRHLNDIMQKHEEGRLTATDIVDAVPSFLAQIPAGMVAGVTETPAYLYETLTGKSVTQAQQDEEGNWYDSDRMLDSTQRLGSGLYGAANLGLMFGGSKSLVGGAVDVGKALAGRQVAKKAAGSAIREFGKSVGEEAVEEGFQTAMEQLRGDENGTQIDRLLSGEANGDIALSAVLGGLGGGIMHGGGRLLKHAAGVINEEDASAKNAPTSEKERANLAPLSQLYESTGNEHILNPVREDMQSREVNPDDVPGVATSLLTNGSFDLGTDEGYISLAQIQNMAMEEGNLEAMYNQFVPESAREQMTLDKFRAIFSMNRNDMLGALNNLITSRAKENPVMFVAFKEPSTNGSPYKFRLLGIKDNLKNMTCQFNAYVHGGFNMDVDGDKIKVSFNPKDYERARYVSRGLLEENTKGEKNEASPFKRHYANIDTSEKGIKSVKEWIKNNIFGGEGHELIERVDDAFSEDAKDVDFARFLTDLGDIIEQTEGEDAASRKISDLLTFSRKSRFVIAIESAKDVTEKKIDNLYDKVNINEEDVIDAKDVIHFGDTSITQGEYALAVRVALGYRANTNEKNENPLFRNNQALLLTLKEKGIEINIPSLFKEFFANKAMLTALGEKPENAIESIFNDTVLLYMQDRLRESGFSFEVGIRSEEDIERIKKCYIDAYNECVDLYNEAVESVTLEGSTYLFGVKTKNKFKSGEDGFMFEMCKALRDVDCSMFLGEDSQYAGQSFGSLMNIIDATKFDSGEYILYGVTGRESQNKFIAELYSTHTGEYRALESRVNQNIEEIAKVGKRFNTKDKSIENAEAFCEFASAVARLIGVDSLVNLNLTTLESMMAHKDGAFWDAITSGDETQIKNAIFSVSMEGKLRPLMERAHAENKNENEIRYLVRCQFGNTFMTNIAIEYYLAMQNGEDLSNTELERICDINIPLSWKKEHFESYYVGINENGIPPMFSYLTLDNNSEISVQSALKENTTVARELSNSTRAFHEIIDDEIDTMIKQSHQNGFELIDYFKYESNRNYTMSDSILANFAYAATTATNALAEKAKNLKAAQALYSSLSLYTDGAILSWQDKKFGQSVDLYNIVDVINNRVLLSEILFHGKTIKCFDDRVSGYVELNADSIYKSLTGRDLQSENKLTNGEFIEILKACPQIATILSPQVIEMSETNDGIRTENKMQSSMLRAFDKYVTSRSSQQVSAYNELINKTIAEMMNDSSFYSILAAQITGWQDMTPAQLSVALRNAAEREARATLAEQYKHLMGGSNSETALENMLKKTFNSTVRNLLNRYSQYNEYVAQIKDGLADEDFDKSFKDRIVSSFMYDVYKEVAQNTEAFNEDGFNPAQLQEIIKKSFWNVFANMATSFNGAVSDTKDAIEVKIDEASIMVNPAFLQMLVPTLLAGNVETGNITEETREARAKILNEMLENDISLDPASIEGERIRRLIANFKSKNSEEEVNYVDEFLSIVKALGFDFGIKGDLSSLAGKVDSSTYQNMRTSILEKMESLNATPYGLFSEEEASKLDKEFSKAKAENDIKEIEATEKKLQELAISWENEIRALIVESYFSGYSTKPNTRFMDQLETATQARMRWVQKISNWSTAEKENFKQIMSQPGTEEDFAELDFLNPYNAAWAAHMQMEASGSGISTLVGIEGSTTLDCSPFAALIPSKNICESNTPIESTPDNPWWSKLSNANYSGKYIIFTEGTPEFLGEPDYDSGKERCYIVSQNLLSKINYLAENDIDVLNSIKPPMFHDTTSASDICNCPLCGGTNIDADGAPKNGPTSYHRLSRIMNAIGKYAMEPRILKFKKRFNTTDEIAKSQDSPTISSIYEKGKDINNIAIEYQNQLEAYQKFLHKELAELIDNGVATFNDLDILAISLCKDVKISFGRHYFCFVPASSLNSPEELAAAITAQVGGNGDTEAIIKGITSIDMNIYSPSHMSSTLGLGIVDRANKAKASGQQITSDFVHESAVSAYFDLSGFKNFTFDDNYRCVLLKEYDSRIKGYLKSMRASNPSYDSKVSLEDDMSRMQKWLESRRESFTKETIKPSEITDRADIKATISRSNTFIEKILGPRNLIKELTNRGFVVGSVKYVGNTTNNPVEIREKIGEEKQSAFKRGLESLVDRDMDKVFYLNNNESILNSIQYIKCLKDSNAYATWKTIEKRLFSESVLIDKETFDVIEKHIPNCFRNIFEPIQGTDYFIANTVKFRSADKVFVQEYACDIHGLDPRDICTALATDIGLSDSSIIYMKEFIERFRLPYNDRLAIGTVPLKEQRDLESKILPIDAIKNPYIRKKILESLDTDCYKGTIYEDFAEARTKVFLDNMMNVKGGTTGYNIESASKGDVVGIMHYIVGRQEKYVPIILNADIPRNCKIYDIRPDLSGNITMRIDGEWTFGKDGENEAFKIALRDEPFKAFATVDMENVQGLKDFKYVDENGDERSVDLSSFWGRESHGIDIDALIDIASYFKRTAGNQAEHLRRNLHYEARKLGYNMFFKRTESGMQLRDDITEEAMKRIVGLANGYEADWDAFNRGDFDLFTVSEENKVNAKRNEVFRKLYTICGRHRMPMEFVIGSIHIPENISSESNGFDGITHTSRDFTQELIYSNFTDAETLLIYNTFNEKLCPPSPNDFYYADEGIRDNYIFDPEGNILVAATDKVGTVRKPVVVSPQMFISPMPGSLYSPTAREGMQYYNDVYMRNGLPVDEQELDNYITNISKRARLTDSLAQAYRDEFNKNISEKAEKKAPEITDDMLLEEYQRLNNLRYLPRYKDMYEGIDKIAKSRRIRINICENKTEDGKHEKYIDNERFNRAVNMIGDALGIPNIDPDIVKMLYEFSIGWDWSPDYDWTSPNKFIEWATRTANAIKNDTKLDFTWIESEPNNEGRYPIALFENVVIDYLASKSKYRVLGKDAIRTKLNAKQREIDKNIALSTDHVQKKHLQSFVDYLRFTNGFEEEVNDSLCWGTSRWSDIVLYNEELAKDIFGGDPESCKRVIAEMQRCTEVAKKMAKQLDERENLTYKDPSFAGGAKSEKRNGEKTFLSWLNNLSILSKFWSFFHISMPLANIADRAVGTTVQNAMFRASMAGHGPYVALKEAGKYVPSRNVAHAFANNPTIQRIWRAYQRAAFEGDALELLTSMTSQSDINAYLDTIENQQDKNILEKAFDKEAYFASGGNFFLSQQLENLITAFVAKAYATGNTYWFDTVDMVDPETGQKVKVTRLESMIAENPTRFLMDIFNPSSPSFVIGQQCVNLVKEGDKAQKNLVSVVYQEIFSRMPIGKFLSETIVCKFPQYASNKIGNILGWIAPVSSLHYLATKWVIKNGKPVKIAGKTIIGDISGEAETILTMNSLREAIYVDAARMGTGMLAMALFGLAAFQPPDDDDKKYNIDEWTIFGFRVSDEWWISDVLGLALPMAATWKLAAMGEASPMMLITGIAKCCYNNPALTVADAVSCVINPDITLDDFVDGEYYDDALGGTPTGLQWLAQSWQALGLSYLSQFFTPSMLREVYRDFNEWEVSTKRIYEENAYGHLTEDGINGKTMVTSFSDQQLRKLCKNNPIIAMAANALLHPNTSYWAYDMPKTVYYDQNQITSMKSYSIYNDDGSEKTSEELDVMFSEIYSVMNSTDDMEELYNSGFYLSYETKSWMSTILWKMVSDITDEYYEKKANGEFDFYVLGNGNYEEGRKLANEIQSAYWDDINLLKSFYYDRLWSEPMRRPMQSYNRINTTYEQDINGNWYATGYRRQANPFMPFMFADGTLSNPENTSGYEEDWATPSAVDGTPLYDENYNGMRGLVPLPLDLDEVPDFDSWSDEEGGGSTNSARANNTGSNNSSNYPSRVYGGGGSGGGGGGYGTRINSNPARINFDRPSTMGTVRKNNADFDYLRPGFTTKGSREAYRREDY